MPGPFAIVAVTVAPGAAVVALGMIVGGAGRHRDVALVASTLNELFRKNRSSWVPGVAGSVNVSGRPRQPLTGAVRVPFRYFESR